MGCFVRLRRETGFVYLSSLYPIQWDDFISTAEMYDTFDDARIKLNSRHYQLARNLEELGSTINDIDLVTVVDGKATIEKYIGGI